MNKLLNDRQTVIANLEKIKDELTKTSSLEKRIGELELEMELVISCEMYRKCLASVPFTSTQSLDALLV